ncbi:MAG: YbjQ family protein [Dehalococcoidia bacterium]
MLMTTTSIVEGRTVAEYLGVVTGESILGAHIGRDIGAMFRNVTGGRVSGYEKELRNAREIAMQEMEEAAKALNADGVLAIDVDYETVGGQMLMVAVSGTAVRFG